MAAQGEDPKVEFEFMNEAQVAELYADEVRGFALFNGTVAMTFEALRWQTEATSGPPKRAAVVRLRMSVTGAQNLATELFNFLAQRGLDPARKPPGEQVQ